MPGTAPRLDHRCRVIPLVDCAPLVVAAEKGFAAAEGLDLRLVREVFWANIRDRTCLGHLDVARMLAGTPIATSLPAHPYDGAVLVGG